MTTELFLHFSFPFSSQWSTIWLLTLPSAEIAVSVGYCQLLATTSLSDELSFYLVSTLLLETAPDLGFCGKFCSLLWLFLVSCLDSSMFSKDSSLATFLLSTLRQSVHFILNLCLNGSKVYIFRLTLNFRPEFPAASWKCL